MEKNKQFYKNVNKKMSLNISHTESKKKKSRAVIAYLDLLSVKNSIFATGKHIKITSVNHDLFSFLVTLHLIQSL